MTAYLMTHCEITNFTDDFRRYVSRAADLVAAHGGTYVLRGQPDALLEGEGFAGKHVILIRFASMAALRGFFESDDYKAAARLREGTGRYETAAWEVG
jgi:uncharacterized protein (DUF1330 family)